MKYKLEKPMSLKKKVLMPIGFFGMFFFVNYFFKNGYTSIVLIISLIAYVIYSIISQRKPYIEFHRDTLELKKPSGDILFSDSIHNLNIQKAELHGFGRAIGQAIIITVNDGKQVSIATYSIAGKWKGAFNKLNEVDYHLNPIKWPLLIERLGLVNETEDQSPTSHDMQKQAEAQKTVLKWAFRIIIGITIAFLLFFGSIFGWIIFTQMN